MVRGLAEAGTPIYATEGTAAMVRALGCEVASVPLKLGEGHPDALDVIERGEVQAIINTFSQHASVLRDGFEIRRAAAERRVPCFTSLDTARAAVESLTMGNTYYSVKPLTAYLNGP